MLDLLPREAPSAFRLQPRFDARTANSRLTLLGLSSLQPRDLTTGAPLRVSQVVEDHELSAFGRLDARNGPSQRSAANRLLHPPAPKLLERLRARAQSADGGDGVLASHAIDGDAARHLRDDRLTDFLHARAQVIERAVERLRARKAAWNRSDRPPIAHLLAAAPEGS